jgi:hypothetical protein
MKKTNLVTSPLIVMSLLAGVVTSAVLLDGPAAAATCAESNHVNVEAEPGDEVLRRGVDVRDPGLYTGGPQLTDCFRVASIDLFNTATNQIEIGWIIDTSGLSLCIIPSGYGTPWLFRASIVGGGPAHCSYYGSPIPDPGFTYSYLVARDTSNTHVFHTYFDGTHIGADINTGTGMITGTPITNAERWFDYDSAYGNWDGLRYKDSTGWHGWPSGTSTFFDDDDGYRNFFNVGGHSDHVQVNPG